MNRLWVRLSIVMSGMFLIFTVLPLFAFLIFPERQAPDGRRGEPTRVVEGRPFFRPWRDLPENLFRAFLLAGGVGVIGGIAASRILAAPVTRLAKAAHAIGAGDLSVRVDPKNGSRELDELAQSFNKMADDLQRAAEVRSNLMADVSHELRTPLTVLEGNLRAALDHVYELDDEQIANLYVQTRHLIQLVSELRELTLAEAAQLPLDKQPLDVGQLVHETVAVFAPLAEERQVELYAQIAPTLPTVQADHSRLRQVLHNLIANALRHTPSGGKITVSGRLEGRQLSLAVKDNGEGIAADQLSHIFDRFYRTDPSRSRETGGSGLGLAIVKAIVETHGGTVNAASEGSGKGSTFTILLPT